MFMNENDQGEFIWHYFLTILIADNTLTGFHCKYTHFTQRMSWCLVTMVTIYGVISDKRASH